MRSPSAPCYWCWPVKFENGSGGSGTSKAGLSASAIHDEEPAGIPLAHLTSRSNPPPVALQASVAHESLDAQAITDAHVAPAATARLRGPLPDGELRLA